MLAEVFQYLFTPCSREARRRGHLREAVSLWSREERCREAWAPHYARCHDAVGRAVAGLPRRWTVLVLGSGLARDVDLDFLSARFQVVLLADIVHLWPVRLRTAFRRNVCLVTLDLSGPDPLAPWRKDGGVDLVISANVLSQLPIPLPEERGRAVVAAHLDALRRFSCRVCLLADVEKVRRNREGRVVGSFDLLRGEALPEAPLSWEWTVAPFGEDGADLESVHRVRAYPDFSSVRSR